MAEEKNQKPASTPEQPDLEAHSDDNTTENNETTQKITRYKKQAARSFVLAFTTLIAIIAVCIAWFVSNTKVTMTGTSISAENTVPFELASAGVRQNPDKLLSQLLDGDNTRKYKQYIDYKTDKTESLDDETLYVGTSSLAWRLSGQQNFYPGASGELEFYFIPKQSDLQTITFQLSLTGYEDDTEGKLTKVEDKVWKKLIDGHILVFENSDGIKGYSNWLGTEKKLQITSKTVSFTKDMPYKVTLYWKWPKYFRNYVYNDRIGWGDLITDSSNEEYKKMNTFVNGQVPSEKTKFGENNDNCLFYSSKEYDTGITNAKGNIGIDLEDESFDSCTKYYNLADEYIGSKAHYIYVEVNVN